MSPINIYTVKNPFMCREGQFEPNKRSLCIGLDEHALSSAGTYQCYLGGNKSRYYEIPSATALEFARVNNSFWSNKNGKKVVILPLSLFTTHGGFEYHELPKRQPAAGTASGTTTGTVSVSVSSYQEKLPL